MPNKPALPPSNHNSFQRLITSHRFRSSYPVISMLVLFATVVLWGILGAKLQNGNADQLADPYLFTSSATFHAAHFPAAHTQLLKWPLFWMVAAAGNTTAAIITATMALVLLTVAMLVLLLYRLDRRPLVFGTTCLLVAVILLCVPPQPYAGGLLPVNLAMLTTRNIEYVLYLAVLVLVLRAKKTRHWSSLPAVILLGILGASDKLFLSLSLGSAFALLLAYAAAKNWSVVRLATRWLFVSTGAWVLAISILAGLQVSGITHITSAGTSPYQTVDTPKDLALGSAYGFVGILTNFGATPAYHTLVLKGIPHQAIDRLFSLGGLAFLATVGALVFAVFAAGRLIWPTLYLKQPRNLPYPRAEQLVLMLAASTTVAIVFFVGTQHYYVVDARYLSISFFTLLLTGVVYVRKHRLQPGLVLAVAATCGLAVISGLYTAVHTYRQSTAALQPVNAQNDSIAQALRQHHVTTVVGDYWRVLPVKLASGNQQVVTPLQDCTTPRQVLTSSHDQPDLRTHSFAYLYSSQQGIADFPACSLQQVVATFGIPNTSILLAGTPDKPTQQLLFYDHGIHKSSSPTTQSSHAPATVLPIGLDDIVGANCTAPTVMTVVAHQDDDILFTNPDLLHAIKEGDCVRTVYLTAGDAGNSSFYWLNRQLGSEAAYDVMLGTPNQLWIQRIVKLAPNEYITVANPRNNHHISLIFFNLPDGNLQGQGFPATHTESLAKLASGAIPAMHGVDGQSTYSKQQLTAALVALMTTYGPAEIHTQADVVSSQYPDHSDHIATGQFTTAAATAYDQNHYGGSVTIPVKRYIGYPTHGYPSNVSGDDLAKKEAAFLAYAGYDGGVCHTIAQCDHTPTYGSYLTRQYQEVAK